MVIFPWGAAIILDGSALSPRVNLWESGEIAPELRILTHRRYTSQELNKTLLSVRNMNRDNLFKKRESNERDFGIAFMTGFTQQYRQVEKIIRKHWHLLLKDSDLAKSLPDKILFIYTKPPTLRLKLAPNVVDPPKKTVTFLDQVGFFSCGRCVMCRMSKHRVRKTLEFTSHSSGESHKINKFITCETTHVTYLLSCPCGLQYMGRTTRALGVCPREHVNRIKKGFKHYSLSNHFRLFHGRYPSGLTFCGIKRVESHWRGGNLKRAISHNETQWIHRLRTMNPMGLNIELDLNCFLSNFLYILMYLYNSYWSK